jgi:hypothetical protein
VFKALLTLHQMIRSGSTDQLLDHLVKTDAMRLRNIGGQNFEGMSIFPNFHVKVTDEQDIVRRQVWVIMASILMSGSRRSRI